MDKLAVVVDIIISLWQKKEKITKHKKFEKSKEGYLESELAQQNLNLVSSETAGDTRTGRSGKRSAGWMNAI